MSTADGRGPPERQTVNVPARRSRAWPSLGYAVELSVDGASRDAEELRGERLIPLRVPQRLADDTQLDLVQRRPDLEGERSGRAGEGGGDVVGQVALAQRFVARK